MKLSIVIPAFNEEKLLRHCLASVRAAVKAHAAGGLACEVIVCDNASTDATAAIARSEGAQVVYEPHRQISRARNAGAAAATGDWLLFIDADSTLHPATLGEMLEVIAAGAHAGGGCVIRFDAAPLSIRLVVHLWNAFSRLLSLAAGSFLFCRADAFREAGGFSTEIYAAEEVVLSLALRRWGAARGLSFAILRRAPHMSSGRKAFLYSTSEHLRLLLRLALSPRRVLSDPKALPHHYDGRR